jgi:hypothetical protein
MQTPYHIGGKIAVHLDRSETIRKIRRACIKANPDLWNDHGDVLKRRLAQGVAVPTRLGLADVLMAWKVTSARKGAVEGDEDALRIAQELIARIASKWNIRKDDINEQDDDCVLMLADLIL